MSNKEIKLTDNISIDFDKIHKVHFIGIGGISMSSLAEILLSKGISISGSDTNVSDLTKHLESLGATINYVQQADNITDDIDLTVYTAAIDPNDPELRASIEKNIPTIPRATLLGLIMKSYRHAIGISGTHGKTSTTSMMSHILLAAETDPTIMVGGILNSINGNLRIGKSETMITEACEYTNSFLSFFPTVAVILNVAEDHMDFFKDIDDIRLSFKKYANLVPSHGTVVIGSDIDNISYFTSDLDCNVITFGSEESGAEVTATNITYDEFANGSFDLVRNGQVLTHIDMKVTGLHNIHNALAAAATAMALDLPVSAIKEGLESFLGTVRRFEKKGELNGFTIVDDYAHHPDEIKTTLETAKNYPHSKLWCVFQPHTYTRTKAFFNEFVETLSLADAVVFADIYA
ncbi:MAG: UDP-N-acetylmuramate--L-alanine ligase, partial [Lachnospiraceae bacterium]|nr:UDP-N-acetylmuramate--L-alanine ligase [Lachnospiraceae bacterium]